jgi:hypothetical protein
MSATEVDALLHEVPQRFRVIGPLSWAGESPTGFRDAVRGPGAGVQASDKPAVFVLPGILGSNLKVDGKRVWLSWRLVNGLGRLEYTTRRPDGIEPDGAIDLTYDDPRLSRRRTRTSSSPRLATPAGGRSEAPGATSKRHALASGAAARRFVAHSMGGLVRTPAAHDVWGREGPLYTLTMLGTPKRRFVGADAGAVGDDTFGNALVAFSSSAQGPKHGN